MKALEAFTRLGEEHRIAECENNLGVIAADFGVFATRPDKFEQARTHYQKAREIRSRLGDKQNVAQCQYNIGVTWRREASSVDASERPILLRQALEVMVPATMFLDGMRFQFTTAADRLAWAGQIDRSTRTLFEVASELGDEVLLADLVESAVNAGVHTISGGGDGDPGAGYEDALSARALGGFASHDFRERTTPDTVTSTDDTDRENSPGETIPDRQGTHLGGTTRLIAGARLPMRPPPRLRMPDTHLALDPWATTGEVNGGHVYPALQRSPQEIAII